MKDESHFNKIFWFVVGITAFGAFFTIYIITIFPKDLAARFTDQTITFWLATAVSGGIGYLIGNSANRDKAKQVTEPGTTTADISATITTEVKDKQKDGK